MIQQAWLLHIVNVLIKTTFPISLLLLADEDEDTVSLPPLTTEKLAKKVATCVNEGVLCGSRMCLELSLLQT